jgi:predicted N-acetyltransferase YhbS
MTKIEITEASLPSLPALRRLFVGAVHNHFQYFPDHVRRRVIQEHSLWRLTMAAVDPKRVVLTAKSDNRIIGYAIGTAPKVGPAQLFWLYVEPDQRGKNLGLSLLSRMLKTLGAKGAAEVSLATHDHRRYYERQGFKWVRHTTIDGVDMDILTFKMKA